MTNSTQPLKNRSNKRSKKGRKGTPMRDIPLMMLYQIRSPTGPWHVCITGTCSACQEEGRANWRSVENPHRSFPLEAVRAEHFNVDSGQRP